MYINDFAYKIMNLWKKPLSYILSVLLLVGAEVYYLMSLSSDQSVYWVSKIDYIKVALVAIIPVFLIVYISYKRLYIPKAKKGKIGILFCINGASERNFNIIEKKFIKPFEKVVNKYSDKFQVLILDDYHSCRYIKKVEGDSKNDHQKAANALLNRNCKTLIDIFCEDGGDAEKILCELHLTLSVVHPKLPDIAQKLLEKDILVAFNPVKTVHIIRTNETEDFHKYTVAFNYIFKFIFATVQLHSGLIEDSLSLLEELDQDISNDNVETISTELIQKSLSKRIGFCNALLAQKAYSDYCTTRNKAYLENARKYINNKYCRSYYHKDINILQGICFYVLERNVVAALKCMNEAGNSDPVIKFNKVFLKLYKDCSPTNLLRAYKVYKNLYKLPEEVLQQVESYIYYEYMEDETNYQFAFLLMLIYDYRNDDILAKRALDRFCNSPLYQDLKRSETVENLINRYILKYKYVIFDESEEYSL